MTTITASTEGGKLNFDWVDGFWVQQAGDESSLFWEYYDSKGKSLLNRLNKASGTVAYGIKDKKNQDVYAPNAVVKARLLHYEGCNKVYTTHTRKNNPDGFDAYFILDYKTQTWIQKTGDNIARMTDQDVLALGNALAKKGGYNWGSMKNRRGKTL